MLRRLASPTLAAVICLTALLSACGDDDSSEPITTTTATPATTASTTTEAPAPTTPATTTTALSETELAFVVWPFVQSTVRYDDPVAAATAFAEELVGFTDPLIGPFQEGDSRSGEVEVRANAQGPVTTVFVRQLGPESTWWVLGSATADIVPDEPAPQSAIDHPLLVQGTSRAFEGTVEVEIVADGSTDRIGTGFVTGSAGPDMGPFSGSIDVELPQGGWGSVIFLSRSAENGQVWQASTVRVGFTGGE